MKTTPFRLSVLRRNARPALLVIAWTLFGSFPVFAERPTAPDPQQVTLALKWFHQFQFAGYYAADAKGYYAEEGLRVRFREPLDQRLPVELVLAGEADYGISAADLLKARVAGQPLVLLATIFQHSPIVLLSRADRGIRTPADLIGKKVMIGNNDYPEILAMLLHEGVSPDLIRKTPHSWRLDELVNGEVDATQQYITDEPYRLRAMGIEPSVMRPIDYGIDFYGDSLFTTEGEIRRHSQRAAAFRQASLRGWEYAMEHVEEMVALILELPGVRERGVTADMLRYEAGQMHRLIQPDLVEIGHTNPGRWRRIADAYVTVGILPTNHSLAGFVYQPGPPKSFGHILFLAAGIVAGFLVVGLIAFTWNRQLRAAVRRNTRELLESRAYLRSIFDASNDGVFVHAEDGTILDVNHRTCEMHGCSREQALSASVTDLSLGLSPYGQTEALEWLRKSKDEGPQTFEWISRRMDTGQLFWTEISIRFARLGDEGRFVVLCRDISDRKRAEQELTESNERLRLLMDTVPDLAIQGYLLDGTVVYWNRGSERLYGYSAAEAIGHNLLDLIIPDEMRAAARESIRRMAETGKALPPDEHSLKRKDGSRISVYSSHAVVNVPGRALNFFCMDIDLTERKRAEIETKKLHDQLAQAQKMESIGRLAGGVAHDFNNMLAVIVGHTDLALEKVKPDQPVYEDLREISKAAQRSSDLTRQLLAYARKQTAAPRTIDLNEGVESALKMLRRLIGENIDLVWLPGANLWPVRIDPAQVDQILANLCVNARDAIKEVGRVTIHTTNAHFDLLSLRPAGMLPGDYVALTVADNGCGMSRDVLEHLFEPFFTTKGLGQGTGLGLATVYGIIRQNDGFIDVKSEPDRGTTMNVYLPRHRQTMPVEGEDAKPGEPTPTVGHCAVLVVEDERAILKLCQFHLERLGCRVLAADNPREALRLAREHQGPLQMLVTDVVMPGMNGRDLARAVKEIHPDIAIVFMSGYTADVIASNGVLDDGTRFIQKPFSGTDLCSKVREALSAPPA